MNVHFLRVLLSRMSRLKNDELRKVRATFDTFRSQCERQLVDLVEENERLREENGQLRLKMAQIERKGPDSGGRRPSRIRKNASASALLAKMPTTSDDEFRHWLIYLIWQN